MFSGKQQKKKDKSFRDQEKKQEENKKMKCVNKLPGIKLTETNYIPQKKEKKKKKKKVLIFRKISLTDVFSWVVNFLTISRILPLLI